MMRTFLVVLLMLTSTALPAKEKSEKISNYISEEKIIVQAKSLMKQGLYDDAIHLYSMLLMRNPFNVVVANNLALAHTAVGNYKAALELLEKAVKLAPKRQDINANLTRVRLWMEEYPEANMHLNTHNKTENYATMAPPKLW